MSYIAKRFNQLMPIVIDVETGGVDFKTDALLEIAAVGIKYDPINKWQVDSSKIFHEHIIPFSGSLCHQDALDCNKIIPDHPLRFAITEDKALNDFKQLILTWAAEAKCKRSILVGHNAHFDLNFLMQAIHRSKIKKFPMHSFTCYDTATLGGMLYRKTVLAQIMQRARIKFDIANAHGALYDATKTAELFCCMTNLIDSQIN